MAFRVVTYLLPVFVLEELLSLLNGFFFLHGIPLTTDNSEWGFRASSCHSEGFLRGWYHLGILHARHRAIDRGSVFTVNGVYPHTVLFVGWDVEAEVGRFTSYHLAVLTVHLTLRLVQCSHGIFTGSRLRDKAISFYGLVLVHQSIIFGS